MAWIYHSLLMFKFLHFDIRYMDIYILKIYLYIEICLIACYHGWPVDIPQPWIYIIFYDCPFSCPASSIPDLGHWVSQWLTATLEFQHKYWLLRPFRYMIRVIAIQKNKKPKRKKTKRKKYKKTKDKRQRPKREFNIAMSGQFRTLAMFYFMMMVMSRKTLACLKIQPLGKKMFMLQPACNALQRAIAVSQSVGRVLD